MRRCGRYRKRRRKGSRGICQGEKWEEDEWEEEEDRTERNLEREGGRGEVILNGSGGGRGEVM